MIKSPTLYPFQVERRLFLGFVVVALLLLCLGSAVAYSFRQAQESSRWVTHTQEVMAQLELVASTVKDAETGQRGYLLTGNEEHLAPYRDAVATVGGKLIHLQVLVSDNPVQQRHIGPLRDAVLDRMRHLDAVLDIRAARGRDAACDALARDSGRIHMNRIRTIVGELRTEEERLLEARVAVRALRQRVAFACMAAAGAASLLLLGLSLRVALREIAYRRDLVRSLRYSEARLKAAQRVAHVGSWEMDARTGRIACSEELLRIAGADGAPDEVDRDAFVAWFDPDDRARVEALLDLAARDGQSIECDLRLPVGDGAARHVHMRGFAMHDETLRVVRVVGTALDITERKNSEGVIAAQVRGLEEAQAALVAKQGELEAANAKLEELATTDALTGLSNRRCFQERLQAEFDRARRYNTPLSVVLMDIDRFKQFNDTFGHQGGDEVLQQTASILRRSVRLSDLAARHGGEEFAIVLPETDEPGAMTLAERFRLSLETAPWSRRPVTASFGVATLTPSTADPDALVRAADDALYASKESGRNAVTHSAWAIR